MLPNEDTEPSPNQFRDVATELIETGVVTITAVEDTLQSNMLVLSLHPALDVTDEAVRTIVEDIEQVRVDDGLFNLYCDIERCGIGTLGRVTVYTESQWEKAGPEVVPLTSLNEGIDQLLSTANGDLVE